MTVIKTHTHTFIPSDLTISTDVVLAISLNRENVIAIIVPPLSLVLAIVADARLSLSLLNNNKSILSALIIMAVSAEVDAWMRARAYQGHVIINSRSFQTKIINT